MSTPLDLTRAKVYLAAMSFAALTTEIKACTLCRDRFRATETQHDPRPVVWFNETARILIAGQAPGLRVHESGKPFTDPSGDRLRDWLGLDDATFYDRSKIAIIPMAFCFPGYNAKGADLPPPKICAQSWRSRIMENLKGIRLTLLIGGYAQGWHLPETKQVSVTDRVRGWRSHMPEALPLPHPSWRNTGWLKKNPWFEADVLPALKARVAVVLA